MFICKECFETLGMDKTKAKALGAVLKCDVCGNQTSKIFSVKESDAVIFVLQVLLKSIKGQQSEQENTQTVTAEDSVTIEDEAKTE